MATINVLLEARAKDKGVRKFFRDATKLADKFTVSAEASAAAGKKLEGISVGGLATGGPRGGAPGRASSRGRGRGRGRDPMAAIARDRARTAKAQNRQAAQVVKQQVAAGKRQTKILNRQVIERQRQSRQIKNLTRAQLEQLEVENEITKRRRRAARQAAQARLGPDPTSRKGKGLPGKGRLEVGASLAIAGAEFEQFGAQVEQGIRTSFNAFKDFEKGVVEVSTLTDKIPVDQIRKITTEAAAEFGGLPTSQVAAFYSIVSAGATDAASATEQLTAANKLAIGGVATQEEAVLAISKSVANFGDQGVDSAKAADILFATVKDGQVTVSELAKAIPAVANQAASMGLRMEDTAAAVAFLSTKMGGGAEAATGLGAAFSNMQKPSRMASKEAKRLGIDFSRAGIEAAGGFEEFLVKIRSSSKFSDKTLGRLFKSSQARSAINNLLRDMEGFNAKLEDSENSAGFAEAAFVKMSNTSAQKAAKFEAQLELLKIQAGEQLVPVLLKLAEVATPFIETVGELIKDNPQVAKGFAMFAIEAAILAKAIGVVTSGLSMWSTLSGVAANKTGALTAKTAAATTQTTAFGKSQGKLAKAGAALPAIFFGAQVAILAFNVVLDQAMKPLTRFEETIDRVTAKQQDIKFKTDDGREKSDEELGRERLNRQIEITNAANTAAFESGGGGIADDANILQKSMAGYAGALNAATGVTDDLQAVADQSNRDLERLALELQEGGTLTAAETQKFVQPEEGLGATLGVLQDLVNATQQVADNTSPANDLGSSMDAGLV